MNRIDFYRNKKRLTYSDISAQTGFSVAYIHMLAKGKRINPSLNTMQKISTALGQKIEKVFLTNERGGESR